MRSGRVVADDAANRGAIGGGRVGAEHESLILDLAVELIEVDARLNGNSARFRLEIDDPVEIFRGVDDQRGADGLPRERRSATAREDRYTMAGGEFHRGDHVIGGTGNNDADRIDLVVGSIG